MRPFGGNTKVANKINFSTSTFSFFFTFPQVFLKQRMLGVNPNVRNVPRRLGVGILMTI